MDYCKKSCGVLALFFVLILSSPFCYAQQDREAQQAERDRLMQEKVTAAEQDIDAKLKPVLEQVNTGEVIGNEDIVILKDILKSNLPYVLRMQPESQSKFYLLSAWTNYYANENQKAVQDSVKAFKADSQYADARATVAAMALMNRDYAPLTMLNGYYQKKERPQQQPRENRRTATPEQQMMPGGMPGPMAPMPMMEAPVAYSTSSSSGEGVLNINMESLIFDLINKPLGVENFVCLNYENLAMATKGRFYSILLWKTNYLDTAEARQKSRLFDNGNETPSQVESVAGEKSPDFEAFKHLYRNSLTVDNAAFVVVNADRKPDKQAMVDFLLLNSGPWANAVLLDPSNKTESILSKIKIDGPLLILVRDNSILYAGSAEGILPLLIMKKQLGADFDVPVAPSDTPLEPVDANIQTQSQDTNEIVEQETAPIIQEKPQPKPKDESQVLTESIEAQNLYQLAEIHFKKGRYIGYKKCVDACREIIEKYPSTVEAQKAKEMLRQLPSDKRKLYGITEEELN